MSEALWMVEYDQVFEDLDAGRIDRDGAIARLRRLGVDQDEAEESVDLNIVGIGG